MTTHVNSYDTTLLGSKPRARDVEVGPAMDPEDHLRAFHLLHERYETMGYIPRGQGWIRITPWNLTPLAHTLVAKRAGTVVGTITCIEDGPPGTPADASYPREMRTFRATGETFAEVSGLAVCEGLEISRLGLRLVRAAAMYLRHELAVRNLIAVAHPTQAKRFYERVLLFERLADEAACVHANGAPGVLLRWNLDTARERYAARYGSGKNLYRFFFNFEEAWRRNRQARAAAARRRNWPRIREALAAIARYP